MVLYKHLLHTVPIDRVCGLFDGDESDSTLDRFFAHCGWKSDSSGFSLTLGVKSNGNPRKIQSPEFTFPNPFYKKNLACEYLQCSCQHQIKVKLIYKKNLECQIYSRVMINQLETIHPPKKKKEIKNSIKAEILNYRQQIPPMKPAQIMANLTNKHPVDDIPAYSTIVDIVEYQSKKKRKNWEAVEGSILNSNNTIFYEVIAKNFIIIIKSNEFTFQKFRDKIEDSTEIVGLDAQYKNNKERYPLWILCAQENYHTIPGFIIMSSSSSAKYLTIAICQIKNYLNSIGSDWSASAMIDKDKSERKALVENGIKFYLCDFHVIKEIEKYFKHFGENKHDAFQKFKNLQRSKTEAEKKIRKMEMEIFYLEKSKQTEWEKFSSNWLSPDWEDAWIDGTRPSRHGLFNTNNAAESWFKILLRIYLGGYSLSYLSVLELIINTIFNVTEIKLKRIAEGSGRIRTAPSEKKKEKIEEEALKVRNIAEISDEGKQITIKYKKKLFCVKRLDDEFKCDCFYYLWFGRECKHIVCVLLLSKQKEELEKIGNRVEERKKNLSRKKVPPRFEIKEKRGRKKIQKLAKEKNAINEKITKSLEDGKQTDKQVPKPGDICSTSSAIELEIISDETATVVSHSVSNSPEPTNVTTVSSSAPENIGITIASSRSPKPANEATAKKQSNSKIFAEISSGKSLGKRIPKKKLLM